MDAAELIRLAEESETPIAELAREAYAPGGPLHLAGFTPRPGQADLGSTLGKAADLKGWVLADAPCGSGKGLGYIVPGLLTLLRARARWSKEIEASGENESENPPPQFVISTYAIGLQVQLITKDIPGVLKALGLEGRVQSRLVKGRNNYVCLDKADALSVELDDGPVVREARRIVEWAKSEEGASGDREDLPFEVSAAAWGMASVASAECIGNSCHYRNDCYANRARRGLRKAEIVVCNHHYLTMTAAQPFKACFLAMDEAHELEHAMRGALAISIRRGSGRHWSDIVNLHLDDPWLGKDIADLVARFFTAGDRAIGDARTARLKAGWLALPEPEQTFEPLTAAAARLDAKGDAFEQVEGRESEGGRLKVHARGLRKLFENLCFFARADVLDWALWLEASEYKGERRIEFKGAPAEIFPAITMLRDAYPAAILTSATLANAGSFAPLKLMMGLDGKKGPEPVAELALPSPFPLPRMGVTVLPPGPSPKDPAWSDWAVETTVQGVIQSQGRALVLCSSISMMRRMGEVLRLRVPYPTRVQGEAGRTAMVDWFKNEVDSVFVATRSMFQGLDVQGSSLSLVVMDRVPFSGVDDPLENVICELLGLRAGPGSQPFYLRTLPQACTLLNQGGGRLIRSADDRGALLILDSRMRGHDLMARKLRAALPPFPVSSNLEDIARVIAGKPIGSLNQTMSLRRTA